MRHIDVYGFDYDYTLASYSNALHFLIYDLAVKELVAIFGYPRGIEEMKYDPDFAIRGLHFDTSSVSIKLMIKATVTFRLYIKSLMEHTLSWLTYWVSKV